MKSFVAVLLVIASASAATTVDVKRDGVYGGSSYAYTVQDQPGVPVPYVAPRGYKADQYSAVPVVPAPYPGVRPTYVNADRPVAYVAPQPGYQSVVPGVGYHQSVVPGVQPVAYAAQPVAYATQPAYVQTAYVPGQTYVH